MANEIRLGDDGSTCTIMACRNSVRFRMAEARFGGGHEGHV